MITIETVEPWQMLVNGSKKLLVVLLYLPLPCYLVKSHSSEFPQNATKSIVLIAPVEISDNNCFNNGFTQPWWKPFRVFYTFSTPMTIFCDYFWAPRAVAWPSLRFRGSKGSQKFSLGTNLLSALLFLNFTHECNMLTEISVLFVFPEKVLECKVSLE